MSTQKFKKGDTVRLKSGGPLMTVESYNIENETEVLCVWFKDNERLDGYFDEDTLEKDDGL